MDEDVLRRQLIDTTPKLGDKNVDLSQAEYEALNQWMSDVATYGQIVGIIDAFRDHRAMYLVRRYRGTDGRDRVVLCLGDPSGSGLRLTLDYDA